MYKKLCVFVPGASALDTGETFRLYLFFTLCFHLFSIKAITTKNLITGGVVEEIIDRPDKREIGQLYYPRARIDREMKTTIGCYEHEYPQGAVIHYTASGSSLYDIDHGIKKHLCYWLITDDGTVFQTAPLDKWGYHAGKSHHPVLGDSLSSKLLGIEVDCPGKLDKGPQGWRTWYGTYVRDEKVRMYKGEAYHVFSSAQMYALERLLIWLKVNNPSVFDFDYVVGHDEISLKKSDPGGCLRTDMPTFRELMKGLYRNELSILGVDGGSC